MDYQTASLATATNTRLDSACKHIQQCRVSYDHMLYFVENAHELERNKMQYCVHKDEMVVGINRPWKKKRVINNMGVSAYPKVFTCLGDITQTRYEHELKMIKYLYHFATSIPQRDAIIGHFDNEGPPCQSRAAPTTSPTAPTAPTSPATSRRCSTSTPSASPTRWGTRTPTRATP